MRRLPLMLCLFALGFSTALAQQQTRRARCGRLIPPVAAERIDRLARWLEAVARHAPGEIHVDLETIAGCSPSAAQGSVGRCRVLAQLSHKTPRSVSLLRARRGRQGSREVRYSKAQVRRMGELSCATDGGAFWDPHCTLISALGELDPELRQMAFFANAVPGRSDSNYFLETTSRHPRRVPPPIPGELTRR